jgi:UDP-N-acetylmuramate dehydrogenase
MTIQENFNLRTYNTFGISASCKLFTDVKNNEEVQEIITSSYFKNNSNLILGGGSNILFTKDFDGLVIKNSLKGIEVVLDEKDYVLVKVSAGEVWHNFVIWSIEHNYAGIENLSLIPGLVGASPMQNIGAYGAEIKDVCESVEAVELSTGQTFLFSNSDCEFGYRESVFKRKLKNRFLITAVTFKLNKTPRFNINYGDIKNTLAEMNVYELSLKAVSNAVIKIRSSKLPDPNKIGNAGSFFKNPVVKKELVDDLLLRYPLMPNYPQENGVKVPAGWLIEQCGWKGKVVGNTGAHRSQALVLVNYGNAIGNEVYNLALEIKQSVKEKFGIDIEPEVNLV